MTQYHLLQTENAKPIKMWTEGVPVDQGAKDQLSKTAQLPFIFKHIAVSQMFMLVKVRLLVV